MAFAVGLIQPINTLPETNSSPLKIGQAPKGNDCIPITPVSGAKC